MNEEEEDSFQAYKHKLEDGLGYNDIKKPMKPMNPYMRYYLEKSSQRKLLQPGISHELLSKLISQEWRNLDESKKQYYNKLYQISRDHYRALIDEYEVVTGKKKTSTLYSSYISKRYAQYSKQHPNKPSKQLMKMANQDWRNMDEKKKKELKIDWENQNLQLPQQDQKEKINEYNEKLRQYTQKIEEEKLKIIKKYRLSQQNLKKLKKKQNTKIGEKNALKKILKQQQQQYKNKERQLNQSQFSKAIDKSKRAQQEHYSLKKREIEQIRRQLRSLGLQEYCKKQLIVAVPADLKDEEQQNLKDQFNQRKEQQNPVKQEINEEIPQIRPKNRRLSKRRRVAQRQSDIDDDYII